MKHIASFLTIALFAAAGAAAKPLKVFLLAGQSNMEGPASINTFDYIADKHEKIKQMNWFLDAKDKDHANADGHLTDAQKIKYLKKYEAELISLAEVALWKRGASNAGYHYLGCAKTFALMGKSFAEATLIM